MLTGPSLPLWDLSQPALGHLQYPWRFLLLVNVGLLGAVASLPALAPRVHPLAWIAGLSLAVMAVALPGLPVEPLALPAADTWAPDRMWQEDAQAGQVGATWTAEFLPLAVTEQRWALGRPREGATDGPPLQPVPKVVLAGRQYAGLTADVDAGAGFALRLHQFQQPGWNARIDGVPVPTYASGEMALVTVDVPAGNHRVTLAFGATPARTAGAILSTLAVLAWALLAWWRSGSRRSLRAGAVVLLLVAGLLLLNGLGVGRRTWVPYPAQTTLSTREGQPAPAAVLVGRDVAPARGANALDVTLYWLALRENGRDYQAFVHLTGPDGAVIAQHDGDPVGGFTPTTRWRSGELIADRHRIALPDDLPPGSYGLKAGLYALDEAGPRNLATDPATPDDRVELGSVALP
jgi:hypothetical protein